MISKSPNLIALLTDFGSLDPYVGVMKGVILSRSPQSRLIDLTHEVPAGNLTAAAYLLRSALPFFSVGTVFLCVVDPGVGSRRKPVALGAGGNFFVGPDNGLFPGALEGIPLGPVVELKNPKFKLKTISSTFHGRDVFAPAAAALAAGVPVGRLGPSLKKLVSGSVPKPIRTKSGWRGEVIWIDRFGNLITNLGFSHVGKKSVIRVGGRKITGLSSFYAQALKGKPLALMGSSGSLEVSVHQGRADQTFRAILGTMVFSEVKATLG
jgi:S-adenosylmethionine hydrolase